jgi:hypothetical protein
MGSRGGSSCGRRGGQLCEAGPPLCCGAVGGWCGVLLWCRGRKIDLSKHVHEGTFFLPFWLPCSGKATAH